MPPLIRIDFRPATNADWEMLLAWRNDAETRRHSLSEEEVNAPDHKRWLAASLENPKRRLFVAMVGDRPIGTVRLDQWDPTTWELSWTVAPEARGQGFGKEMVSQATMLTEGSIVARIKGDNPASGKIAEAAGFAFEKVENGVGVWRLTGR